MSHYVDENGNYLGQFISTTATQINAETGQEEQVTITPEIPDGAVAVPSAPVSAADTWDGSAWVVSLTEKRAQSTITRAEFLKACVAAGIITAEVAKEAATGTWPAAFNTFISGLSDDDQITAITTWTDAREVRRTAPILALVAANRGVSDATLDTMFGIS